MASNSAATNAGQGTEVDDWELVDSDPVPIGGGWTAVVRTGPEDESTTTVAEEPTFKGAGNEAGSSAAASSASASSATASATSNLSPTAPVFFPRDSEAIVAAPQAYTAPAETQEESRARRTIEGRMAYYGKKEYEKLAKQFGW